MPSRECLYVVLLHGSWGANNSMHMRRRSVLEMTDRTQLVELLHVTQCCREMMIETELSIVDTIKR
jgi:hypothetical protein